MIGITTGIVLIVWAFFRNRVAFVALCFLLIGFLWRLVAAAYLDLAGPLYSNEVEMMVGGDTLAANMFGAYISLTVGTMLFLFRPGYLPNMLANMKTKSTNSLGFSLGDLAFYISAIFISILFIELIRSNVIPLFDCIERYDYLNSYAGYSHKFLFKYGSLIVLQFGVFTVYPRLLGSNYDWRFIALLAVLYLYFLLTGNRFSAFYSSILFYITPFSLVLILKAGLGKNLQDSFKSPPARKGWLVGLIVAGGLIVVLSLMNSYGNVRQNESTACNKKELVANKKELLANGTSFWLTSSFKGIYDRLSAPEVQKSFSQRVLVQPIQVYFLTSFRVIDQGDWDPGAARSFIFDPERASYGNRSIRFLMNRTLMKDRASYLESVGNQFAGGYPEVLLELAGSWGTLICVVALALVTGLLLRFWMVSLLRGYFLTAFFAAYVYYAFAVMYTGGMLNFLIVWTFWSKVALLVVFSWLEPYCDKKGVRLLPWRLSKLTELIRRH
jgi:hypothetical protein